MNIKNHLYITVINSNIESINTFTILSFTIYHLRQLRLADSSTNQLTN